MLAAKAVSALRVACSGVGFLGVVAGWHQTAMEPGLASIHTCCIALSAKVKLAMKLKNEQLGMVLLKEASFSAQLGCAPTQS